MIINRYREQLARETAEHIITNLIPQNPGGPFIVGRNDTTLASVPMPTTVEDVAATLLDGRLWLSWMDDRTVAAMRQLHPAP